MCGRTAPDHRSGAACHCASNIYPPQKLTVFVDDITAFVSGRNEELVELAEKVLKTLKKEVDERERERGAHGERMPRRAVQTYHPNTASTTTPQPSKFHTTTCHLLLSTAASARLTSSSPVHAVPEPRRDFPTPCHRSRHSFLLDSPIIPRVTKRAKSRPLSDEAFYIFCLLLWKATPPRFSFPAFLQA